MLASIIPKNSILRYQHAKLYFFFILFKKTAVSLLEANIFM